MTNTTLHSFMSNIIEDVHQRIYDERQEEILIACKNERDNNIAKATVAILEFGASDENTLNALQKHWDLWNF